MIVEDAGAATIRLTNGLLDVVTLKLDEPKNAAVIGDDADPSWKCEFVCRRTDGQQLSLEGRINGNAVSMKLHRADRPKSILVTRGFHWINEHPF